ncbi:hypothetical protein BK769_15510 [Bacillus thuringiensis serovar kumamtoensis]|uniref:Uncharacterized protein n=1 Tax=Bacillus thuringiensis serovar kumamotoensis TaxID=132267 RepID=A0A9X6JP67_BACUK|nr:hypothetical protein BK769_15510 [Bacillus thuringiensis serovar kumamtoensis]
MEFDRLTHAIGKMICVVRNKTLKHMNMQLSVRYGYSTAAYEPIRPVVRVVMASAIPGMNFAFGSKNPTAVSQLASLGQVSK